MNLSETPLHYELFAFGLAALLAALVLEFAYRRAKERKENEAWFVRYQEMIAKDRACRDRLGRWLPKELRKL